MQIDQRQVRGLGGRIRTVGQDAESYLNAMSGSLEQGCQGNDGFAAVAALRDAIGKLHQQTAALATESQSTGDKVVVAADNHQTNDAGQSRNFQAFAGQLGGRH